MHRSIAYIGAGVLVFAIALLAFPLWAYGAEQWDLEQELGILVVPFALITFLIAATTADPHETTVGGTFGNPEYDRATPSVFGRPASRPRIVTSFSEATQCLHCGTVIAPNLANCLRCGRARPCRTCHRPMGLVLERPTCPACARAEPLCNCPILHRPTTPVVRSRIYGGRR
jgi:hypothetical protein